MKKIQKILIPVAILAVTAIAASFIKNNPPKSQRGKVAKTAQMTVEVKTLALESYSVVIESFGTVKPRIESVLISQVSGQITDVRDQFREGGFFEQGDVLITLDDRDYLAEKKIAQASLMSAKQALLEEKARVEQALVDWKRLGNGDKPSALVLREPQLAAAKAQVLSAHAQLEKANLALERSKIIAPYAGRILKKHVDLGQVVSVNTQLANIYATDTVEIRLPIKNKDLDLMIFPEEYRNSKAQAQSTSVELLSQLVSHQTWQGNVIRTESAIDSDSQQLYIVAQIKNPFDVNQAKIAPIKIGQYVTAKIQGKKVEDAIVIPNSAIYQGSYVYIVEQGVLKRKDIQLRWQNSQDAIVSTGLKVNDNLVITPLGQVSSGTVVNISGHKNKRGRS
ncbi:efflux RND transporter periplasmic adaptor subunit [Pseudoalteromonas denitrificans]|uniref:RND family efflux transporter, MFP subunit n=1 Tax=Pseudoalteromonas denitrificans DSM 6059 TaxID=1123010 RepID=A0A1I1PPE6_9GAMM|nr:efflux RND transporter periplasmic adaptor subunit [Pseudoalteromonas denitrificans]SFD11602.1 RND family efflux transporter, MFP subunit [Pseudoalteromonas denitrificans DSM 6059]